MSNEKKRKKVHIVLGVLLGILLSAACQFLPEKYQATCNVVAEVTAMSCGG